MSTTQDPYAPDADTSAGRVFTVTGQDWDSITEGLAEAVGDGVPVLPADGEDAAFTGLARLGVHVLIGSHG